MSYILLNNEKYPVLNIKGQTIYKDNFPRESVTFVLDFTKYTFEEANNIFSNMPNEFSIFNDDDVLQGKHKGFIYLDKIEMKVSRNEGNESKSLEVTVYATTDTDQKVIEHSGALQDLKKTIDNQNIIINNLGKELSLSKLNTMKGGN